MKIILNTKCDDKLQKSIAQDLLNNEKEIDIEELLLNELPNERESSQHDNRDGEKDSSKI